MLTMLFNPCSHPILKKGRSFWGRTKKRFSFHFSNCRKTKIIFCSIILHCSYKWIVAYISVKFQTKNKNENIGYHLAMRFFWINLCAKLCPRTRTQIMLFSSCHNYPNHPCIVQHSYLMLCTCKFTISMFVFFSHFLFIYASIITLLKMALSCIKSTARISKCYS